ncbi:putative PEP-binding protein [Paenibacillus sp. AN1007]|uniref:Pyruvate, phosphate dikinase n=1 Tax=Paenibacillus sp. AN1007 TaxID=3151385 RepID=A0AAU8NL23_9BACL
MTKRVMLIEEDTAEMKGMTHSIGAALAELKRAGWSVPAGMVVTVDGCRACCTRSGPLSGEMMEELGSAVRYLEQQTGMSFGDPDNPLLLEVQSDEAVNASSAEACRIPYVGLNDSTVEGFARQTGNRLYALQCYLAALQHYGQMVLDIPDLRAVHSINSKRFVSTEMELELLIAEWKERIQVKSGYAFPQDVNLQLQTAVRAVLASPNMMNDRTEWSKEKHLEDEAAGAPVLIQSIVHGNYTDYKGKGSVYTRNPETGQKGIIGDYLPARSRSGMLHALSYLKRNNPARYTDLEKICIDLEKRTGAVQEITYTVDSGSIWIHSVKPAYVSPIAAVRSAVDMVHEGLIDQEDALLRLKPEDLAVCMNQELPEMKVVLEWADEVKSLSILAKVEHAADAVQARAWGAEGIGLCTTETMLLCPSRKPFVQKMIMANTEADRRRGMERLLPMQQSDIESLFEMMDGRPVTIQLFDFPLHELFPGPNALEAHEEELDAVLSEIHEMQLEALFRAAVKSIREGLWVRPEIMIPHVEHVNEMQKMRDLVDHVAEQVLGEERRHCVYKVGVSIASSRSPLMAAQLARCADFISFAVDEMTQSTFGWTLEEADEREHFYGHISHTEYHALHKLDIEEISSLVKTAAAQGRVRRPHLKTSISGELIEDSRSIAFIHDIGLDAVCCRPEQIPGFRLAAAQAVIRALRNDRKDANEDVSTIA